MMELVQLQKNIDAFKNLGVEIIAVTTEGPQDLAKARSKVNAEYRIVQDQDMQLMGLFNLKDETPNPTGGDVFRSGKVLVSPEGEVLWLEYADNYRVRPRPGYLRKQIQEVLAAQ